MEKLLRSVYKTLKSIRDWTFWSAIAAEDCHYLMSDREMDCTIDLCRVKPLKLLFELLNWRPDQLNITKSYTRPSLFGSCRRDQRGKILLCHDFKGNYLADSYHVPMLTPAAECYALSELWHSISCFCYFSHHLLTIPPVAWIIQAHARGIPVIGTFITEWDAGAVLCRLMLSDVHIWKRVATQMAAIAHAHGFEGYLINIENKLPKNLMAVMLEFVRFLRYQLRRVVGEHALVIWYDAVTLHGKLAWQNALTKDNACFLDECDGIFLNYCWNENGLRETIAACCDQRDEARALSDVFVGVDVFGRGMQGGGGFATNFACETICRVSPDFSIALFAPGWVMQTNETGKFLENQRRFHRECVLPYATAKQQKLSPHVVGNDGVFMPLSPWTGRPDTIYVTGRQADRFRAKPKNSLADEDELLIVDLSQEALQPFDCSTKLLPSLSDTKLPHWSYDAGYTGNGCFCVPPLAERLSSFMTMPQDTEAVFLNHVCLLAPNISITGSDVSTFSLSIKYKCDIESCRLIPIIVERNFDNLEEINALCIVGQLGDADAARISILLTELFDSVSVRSAIPTLNHDEALDDLSGWHGRTVEINCCDNTFNKSAIHDFFLIIYSGDCNAQQLPVYLQDCFLQHNQTKSSVGSVQRLLAASVVSPQVVSHNVLHFEVSESQLTAVIGWKVDCDLGNLPSDCRFLIQVRILCSNAGCSYCKGNAEFTPFVLTLHAMVQLSNVSISCAAGESLHSVEVEIVPLLLRQFNTRAAEHESAYRLKLL